MEVITTKVAHAKSKIANVSVYRTVKSKEFDSINICVNGTCITIFAESRATANETARELCRLLIEVLDLNIEV